MDEALTELVRKMSAFLEDIDPGSQHNLVADWVRRMSSAGVSQGLRYVVVGAGEFARAPLGLEPDVVLNTSASELLSLSPLRLGNLLFNAEAAVFMRPEETAIEDGMERAIKLVSGNLPTFVVSVEREQSGRPGSRSRAGTPTRQSVYFAPEVDATDIARRIIERIDNDAPSEIRAASLVFKAEQLTRVVSAAAEERQSTSELQARLASLEVEFRNRGRRRALTDEQKSLEAQRDDLAALADRISALHDDTVARIRNIIEGRVDGLNPKTEIRANLAESGQRSIRGEIYERLLHLALTEPDEHATGAQSQAVAAHGGSPMDRVWNFFSSFGEDVTRPVNPSWFQLNRVIEQTWTDARDSLARAGRRPFERFAEEFLRHTGGDYGTPPAWAHVRAESEIASDRLRMAQVQKASAGLGDVDVPKKTISATLFWGLRSVRPYMMYIMLGMALVGAGAQTAGASKRILAIGLLVVLGVLMALVMSPARHRQQREKICGKAADEMSRRVIESLQEATDEICDTHLEQVMLAVDGAREHFAQELEARKSRLESRLNDVSQELSELGQPADAAIARSSVGENASQRRLNELKLATRAAQTKYIDGFSANISGY